MGQSQDFHLGDHGLNPVCSQQSTYFFNEQYVISAARGFSIKTKQKMFTECCVEAVEQSAGQKCGA